MAYLGNAPVVGDSANTFKLLDDIASFTLTFDGSSADVVSVANDTLTFTNHRFVTGQRVTYTDGGGTVITGLTDGTAYFIIKVDQSTIKLATNASNAASSTAIDLTGLGAGASHTLKVAFDGVNTKFKATHSSGTKASVSRAAQLSLSINGVIQQPTETKPPTVGYGIEADSTIVFSTAPVATDKVFGSFIGEVAPSFDLTDNTISNFTGDGSTTSFNLSKEIPSSQDVLVTLDGVTQHPTDASTTRAYSVIGSTLTFTSAPADGVSIQTRLIGFAGATSSEVTGFYGRTGNVALKNTDDITFQNASAGIITASKFVGELVGVVTATDFFVSGIATFASDVGIAGTLTYEDVTNIDSVGIITARSNILVGSGITLSPDGDIFATGISTFSEGFAGDVLIDDKIVHRGDTDTAIRFPEADKISFETGGSERVRIDSSGRLLVGTDASRQTRAGNASYSPDIQLESTQGTLSLTKINDSANPSRISLQKARGSQSSPDIVQADDEIGSLTFNGWDGDTFTNSAMIRSSVDGTPGDDDMPGNLEFYTTADGASTTSERMRITSSGKIGMGVDNPQAKLDIKVSSGIGLSLTTAGSFAGAELHLNGARNAGTGVVGEFIIHNRINGQLNKITSDGSGKFAFLHDGSELMGIDQTGVMEVSGGRINLTKQGASNLIKVGSGQNASNYAYIDFIGDTHWPDYALRLLRGQTGENAVSQLIHRGTGTLQIRTSEAAPISFMTNGSNERLGITSDGQVNIGEESPTASENGQLNVYITTSGGKAQIVHSAGAGGLRLAGTGGGSGSNLVFSNNYNSGTFTDYWTITHNGGDDSLRFLSGGTGGDEKMRLDTSGTLVVGYAGNTSGLAHFGSNSSNYIRMEDLNSLTYGIVIRKAVSSTYAALRLVNTNGHKGNLNVTNSGVALANASDYRLKENETIISDGITRVKQLIPRRFNFKSDSTTVDGFFAHEVSPVVPESVFGEKDVPIDEEGDGYQMLDQSKLIPVLTASMKELIAKVETLETKVSALEG